LLRRKQKHFGKKGPDFALTTTTTTTTTITVTSTKAVAKIHDFEEI